MEIIENDIYQFDKKPHSDDILQIALRNIKNTISPIKCRPELPEINLKEVSNHDSINDCWIVLYDRVYDVTKFLDMHPGGADIILENAGRDATLPFNGTGHSSIATNSLKDFLIGQLPTSERLYRKSSSNPNNSGIITLSNVPE